MPVTSHSVADFSYSGTVQSDADVLPLGPVIRRFIVEDTIEKDGPKPQWRKIIAAGGNANTSMYGTKWTLNIMPAKFRCNIQWKHSVPPIGLRETKYDGNVMFIGIPGFTLNKSEVSADNLALQRYYENCASVESVFKGMVFSGELRETLNMLVRPAKALRTGISDYLKTVRKRSRRLNRTQASRIVAQTWLEYAFGWKPLAHDIEDACRALRKSKYAFPIFQMVRGSAHDKEFTDTADINTSFSSFWSIQFTHHRMDDVFVQYRGNYFASSADISGFRLAGFRPTEFFPTIWELIPYSFLVDYFTNIGGIISSLSYWALRPAWTAKLVRWESSVETADIVIKGPDGFLNPADYSWEFDGNPGYAKVSACRFVRVPSVEPGIPSLELKVPGMNLKWINMAALLTESVQTRNILKGVR